jgi:hypothetical protein
MRLVTAKPPKIFILAMNIAKPDKTKDTVSVEDT